VAPEYFSIEATRRGSLMDQIVPEHPRQAGVPLPPQRSGSLAAEKPRGAATFFVAAPLGKSTVSNGFWRLLPAATHQASQAERESH
jgi:hypothetical protein